MPCPKPDVQVSVYMSQTAWKKPRTKDCATWTKWVTLSSRLPISSSGTGVSRAPKGGVASLFSTLIDPPKHPLETVRNILCIRVGLIWNCAKSWFSVSLLYLYKRTMLGEKGDQCICKKYWPRSACADCAGWPGSILFAMEQFFESQKATVYIIHTFIH